MLNINDFSDAKENEKKNRKVGEMANKIKASLVQDFSAIFYAQSHRKTLSKIISFLPFFNHRDDLPSPTNFSLKPPTAKHLRRGAFFK